MFERSKCVKMSLDWSTVANAMRALDFMDVAERLKEIRLRLTYIENLE
jgi:hypothetical protein